MFDKFGLNVNSPGLNVAGYLTAELGLGEVARNYVSVIQHLGVATSLQDASFITHQRKSADEFSKFTCENPYPANLVCINAPEIKHFIDRFGAGYFRTKYNIGSWWWEVEELPQDWMNEFHRFDELWVGTHFIQRNLARVSPIPVHVVQPYVVPLSAVSCRAELGLSENDFIFLFAFDYFSCFERKNPIGLVRAFKQAFKKNEHVKLVIKTTNGDKFKAKSEALEVEVGADPGIILLDKYFSKPELNNLIASCNAYVSLHRTEGFGLPIAEAMLLKKPVIATGWSGNLDFNNEDNSLLVRYDFSTNLEDYGPYKKGMRWAEPDIEHAAKLMRLLFDDQTHARLLGMRGFATIHDLFGREAVGQVIAQRLATVSRKVYRVAQIDSFKKGLLSLENAQTGSSGDQKGEIAQPPSESLIDAVDAFFSKWWHRPVLGKPLRLFTKCFSRFLKVTLKGSDGAKFRTDLIETTFEGVAKLAKVDSDEIEQLEKRLEVLESELNARKIF